MAEMMSKSFNVPFVTIVSTPLLSACISQHSTCLVVDIGDSITHITPVHEGVEVSDAIIRLEIGGRDLTDEMVRTLSTKRSNLSLSLKDVEWRKIVQDIKEKLCYVASDATDEGDQIFELPGGQIIHITDDERYRCCEALFTPTLIGKDCYGIHEAIAHAINKCDKEIQSVLYGNVIICGGTSMLPGLAERLHTEVASMSEVAEVGIVALPHRKHLAWMGGSLLGAMPYAPSDTGSVKFRNINKLEL